MNPEAINLPDRPVPAMPEIPVGKKVERPEPEPQAPLPDLEDLAPQIYSVNPTAVSELYDRASRPAPEGEINRKNLTFTITPQTDDEWRDFLEVYTGTLPQRGKGISSPMVELSMQVLMGIIADFRLDQVAGNLRDIAASDMSREEVRANLHKLAEQI